VTLVDLIAEKRKSPERVIVGEQLTDRGHARRLCTLHGHELRWVTEDQAFAHYDGRRWRRRCDEKAFELVQGLSDAMLDARGLVADGKVEPYIKAAGKLQSSREAAAVLKAARPMLLVHANEFDARPYLLNAPNGTLDLRTLERREHDPADLLTLATGASYEPGATSALWDQVITKALPDSAMRTFLQVLAGITLAGHEQLDLVLLIYGVTRTMKGTIQGAIGSALGSYAVTAGLEDFAVRDRASSGPRPELVRLAGARMVSIYETSRSLKIEPALLKSLSGADPITARDMYSRPVTFAPQFTLWVASNYRPGLPADDDAVWRRVRELPFTKQIAEGDEDPTIRAQLRDPDRAGPAVLAWAVEGLRLYREKGLTTPDQVRAATTEYRESMDELAGFADERLVFGDRSIYQATPAAIRSACDDWVRANGAARVLTADLNAWLEGRSAVLEQSRQSGRTRLWHGVGVVAPEERPR
jgi:putative DNA primase/helicase